MICRTKLIPEVSSISNNVHAQVLYVIFILNNTSTSSFGKKLKKEKKKKGKSTSSSGSGKAKGIEVAFSLVGHPTHSKIEAFEVTSPLKPKGK